MRFYSTNRKGPQVNLRKAVMSGLAPDGGLYMPADIPVMPASFFKKLPSLSFQETALEVSKRLFGRDIPARALNKMVERAFDFPVPLVRLAPGVLSLELFHGPTLAFKDFAARFMGQVMSFFAQGEEITVLTATSGDTGGAVANGFLGLPGVKVVILYPGKKVSPLQEAQFARIGGNVTAVEVKGTFDDCQALVKGALLDAGLKRSLRMASANSINVARLLPQTFYYFFAFARCDMPEPVFSVPSGNFGGLTAGLIAKKMGLPAKRFVAATNANDTVPRYLKTGRYEPRTSRQTISNAMDVGDPSNFCRMLELYKGGVKEMRRDVVGFSFSDAETKKAMREVFERYDYVLDPHGAVAYLGLKKYGRGGIFLETAHPAKFAGVVEGTLGTKIAIPARLKACLKGAKRSILVSNSLDELKTVLVMPP
jgi:threonine synthase